MKKQLLQFIALGVLGFTACSKDDSAPADTAQSFTVNNLTANIDSTNNHYTFYSLEKGQIIPVTDSATNKWDIAFKSTTILVNSGTSGPSNCGAFVQRSTTFENYKTIPTDSTFYTDGATSKAITTGSGKGWYSYDMNTHLITPIAGNLIVVKTASGKYAKIEILSYYRNAPASPADTDLSAFYKFRYILQTDGSKTF